MINKQPHTNIQDCAQAGTINSIFQVLEQLSLSHLEEKQERRESEKRIITALEKVADQGARIANLESMDVELKHDINVLYGIQREQDKNIKTEDPRIPLLFTFYQLTTNKYAVAMGVVLLSLILIGSLNDLVYHSTLFTNLTTKLLGLLK